MGGGLPVDDLLNTPTFGPHWKEYSLRELMRYFSLLSPDFVPHKGLYVDDYYDSYLRHPFALRLEKRVRVLRPNLHVEIQLTEKRTGIVLDPRWY
jgi:2-polyprenyl-6-hydroxyphenyl methylase/3-demethylubiquinone-9 3-methyltransferase